MHTRDFSALRHTCKSLLAPISASPDRDEVNLHSTIVYLRVHAAADNEIYL